MQNKIVLATVCLRISEVLNLAVGLLGLGVSLSLVKDSALGLLHAIPILVFFPALIVGIEFILRGLRRRRFWAWIAGICVFVLYLPSPLLPLGALGLWGLLDSGSRAEFEIEGSVDRA